jgi:hypothetical protein
VFDIYLDIDGVLLANDKEPAKYAEEFLTYITNNYTVYWLTTHVHGDNDWVIEFLGRFLSPIAMQTVAKIQVTPKDWETAKTEAVDFSRQFLWIDDDLYEDERSSLIAHGVLDNWVEVDLAKDENRLLDLINNLPKPVTP